MNSMIFEASLTRPLSSITGRSVRKSPGASITGGALSAGVAAATIFSSGGDAASSSATFQLP
ncbi:MAG TPA: hypothetical protein EYM34_00590, partial [Alphaproteobacteria bacterium]|nr:hypothetical protein [Alphaproteobacteria bacterium]